LTPEARIKSAVLRYLEQRGFFVWNNPTGCVRIASDRWISFGKKGSSDILGCLPDGRFLAVEIKTPKGRVTPEQTAFLKKVRGLGGVAIIVNSFQELDAALRSEGYANDGLLFEEVNNATPYGAGFNK